MATETLGIEDIEIITMVKITRIVMTEQLIEETHAIKVYITTAHQRREGNIIIPTTAGSDNIRIGGTIGGSSNNRNTRSKHSNNYNQGRSNTNTGTNICTNTNSNSRSNNRSGSSKSTGGSGSSRPRRGGK